MSDPHELANIPADLKVVRRSVVPKHEGWVISDFDFSKIEPRLLAYFASKKGDDTLAGYLRQGRDPYRAIVSDMYRKDESELTDIEYKQGKILFLSLVYGAGVRSIRAAFGLDQKAAKARINQFHRAWPIVRELQDDVVSTAYSRGYIRTPWGRRLHLEPITRYDVTRKVFEDVGHAEHKLLNKLIQGSAAHALKRALIRTDEWLQASGLESHMILTIHDSIDFDGPADEVSILHENVPRLMTDEPLISVVVPILVEHEVSVANWAEKIPYEEWKELHGISQRQAA